MPWFQTTALDIAAVLDQVSSLRGGVRKPCAAQIDVDVCGIAVERQAVAAGHVNGGSRLVIGNVGNIDVGIVGESQTAHRQGPIATMARFDVGIADGICGNRDRGRIRGARTAPSVPPLTLITVDAFRPLIYSLPLLTVVVPV